MSSSALINSRPAAPRFGRCLERCIMSTGEREPDGAAANNQDRGSIASHGSGIAAGILARPSQRARCGAPHFIRGRQ
jgi:hypothetical protein